MQQQWDESTSTLSGVSETVPGDAYTLWFHLPKGVTMASAKVEVGGQTVAVQSSMKDDVLTISFAGQAKPAAWTLKFAITGK